MRKISLVLAAAVMTVGLAVSGGAWAAGSRVKDKQLSVNLIMDGDIIHKGEGSRGSHTYTIIYFDGDNFDLYFCVAGGDLTCWKHSEINLNAEPSSRRSPPNA